MSSVYLILPCYDLCEFTLSDNDSDGPSIMSAWMAAFDPENLLLQETVPQWIPGYTPEEHPQNALILMPNFVYGADYAWLDECRCNGCEVVEFGGETLDELIGIVREKLKSCELRVARMKTPHPSLLTPHSRTLVLLTKDRSSLSPLPTSYPKWSCADCSTVPIRTRCC